MGPADHAEIVAQVRLLAQATPSAEVIVAALARSGKSAPAGFTEALARSRAHAKLADETFASATPVRAKTANRLQAVLGERTRRLQQQWLLQFAVGLETVSSVVYLATVYFRNSFGVLRVLQGSVAQLAAGNFTTKVRPRGTGELSEVAQAIDGMTGRLSEMVAGIRSNSTMVARAGFSLAEDTKKLSERTERRLQAWSRPPPACRNSVLRCARTCRAPRRPARWPCACASSSKTAAVRSSRRWRRCRASRPVRSVYGRSSA